MTVKKPIEKMAKDLFDYAAAYARRHELADKGTQYPTVRTCAKRFRVSQRRIQDIASDGIVGGYLGLAVALHAGGGVAALQLGDQLVEAVL